MCLDRSESWKRERSRSASPVAHVCCSLAMTSLSLQRCFAGAQLFLCLGGMLDEAQACQPQVRLCTCTLQLRRDTYTRLTPVQRLQVARHPNRPTFLDIALNISDK